MYHTAPVAPPLALDINTHQDQDIGLDHQPAGAVELGCQPHASSGSVGGWKIISESEIIHCGYVFHG